MPRPSFLSDGADPGSTGSSRAKPEIEARAVWRPIGYSDAGAVRLGDLHHDRQSQPGSLGSDTSSPPESIEDVRSIIGRYARSIVQNTKGAFPAHIDNNLGSWRGVRERV